MWVPIFVVVALICSALSTANNPEFDNFVMVIIIGFFIGVLFGY